MSFGGRRLGFIAAACSLAVVFAASASPIPLYEVYRQSGAVAKSDLALTAVAYFVAVMAALIFLGRVSNHVGRRPVAVAALAITAAGCLVLTDVHSIAPLIVGRLLQGIGCGLASSALTAFVVDSAPVSPGWLGSAVTTGAPMIGLTAGALGCGVLANYGPAPRTLVYFVAVGALATCALLVLCSRETVARTGGAMGAARPQLRLPASARAVLPVASCTFVATWALGGFYQAFGPTIASDQLGSTGSLVGAAVFASLMAPSAIGAPLAGRVSPASAQRFGMVAFFLAVVGVLVSLGEGSVVPFVAASAVAGAAQGATFAGSMRALLAGASPADRAGILSVIYLVSYAGAAIPSLIAGQLAHSLSFFEIALGYGALAALACAVTLVAAHGPLTTRSRHEAQPQHA